MRSREFAQLLSRKAKQDEFTMEKLIPDPDSPDEIIGFHAQQAVEKMLKAVLASRAARHRRTHDLVELIDLIKDCGLNFPEGLEFVRRLTPFAAEFRYEDLGDEREPPFDRAFAMPCVRDVEVWVRIVLGEEKP